MNERFKRLAEQSGMEQDIIDDDEGTIWWIGTEDLMKFGAAIVQDCITQAALVGISNSEEADVVWTVEKIIENIQIHFEMR